MPLDLQLCRGWFSTQPRSGDSTALTCEALRELLYFGGDEVFASKSLKPIQGYHLIKPEDLV